MTRLQHRSGALPAGRDFLRTDAKTDVVGDRNHLILVGMAAVWFTLLVFTVQRLVVALQTGLLTPWWGNAAGLVALTALWAWYRRRPQTRSSGAAHGTALIATITLLIPVAYGLTSTIWWLSLVGFAAVMLGRRQEGKVWGVTIPVVMVASVIAEPYVQIQGVAGELPLELALAKIVFVVILIGMAVGFRRVVEQRALVLHDSEAGSTEALKKSQDLLTQAEKLGKVGGWEFDIETKQQTWTETVYEIHELDITNRPTVDQGINFYTPASRPIIERAVQRAIEQGEPFDLELEIITAKGNLRSVHAIGKADLERRKVSGFFQDITERERAEAELQASEAKFRTLAENVQVGIVAHAPDTSILLSNPMATEILGLTSDQIRGKKAIDPAWRFIREDGTMLPLAEYPVNRVLAEEMPIVGLVLGVLRPDRELPTWVECNARKIWGPTGELEQAIVVFADITERKKAEQALLQSRRAALNMMTDAVEARDRSEQMSKALRLKNYVFDSAMTANSIADLNGVITEANSAFVRVWGFSSKDEVVGKPIPYFLNDQNEAVAIVTTLNSTGQWEGDYTAKRKDGTTFIVHGVATTVKDGKGTVIGYQSACLDATEQREAEKELKRHRDHLEQLVAERTADLKKSEEKFRTLADFTYEWEYWIGPDRSIIYMSPSCERITGYLADEFYKNPGFMDTIIHPKDKAAFKEHVNTYHIGGRRGEPCEFEFWIIDKGGREKLIAHVCCPVIGADGLYRGRRVSNRDITDRKHAEEELKRQSVQLEAANKELEAFSYSVSHDLKAPLRSVDGFARMLEEDYAERLDDEGRRLLQVIRDSAQDMGQLINDLLEFSRLSRKDLKTGRIGMSELVEDVRRQIEQAETGRAIRWDLGELPPAFGDEASIRVVLINLLANAVKFTRPRREAAIGISGRVEGNDVVYSVTDNGVGFDMAYRDKLFCVFQRLHAASEFEGTGIGLALVQRIVLRHGGQVWAEGKVNEGATFYFALPCRKNEEDEMRQVEKEEETT